MAVINVEAVTRKSETHDPFGNEHEYYEIAMNRINHAPLSGKVYMFVYTGVMLPSINALQMPMPGLPIH